ncbi:MAG: DUF2807 domain-containing protein, partial [Deltaproteobacteria bacterium]|nr:DUF2807 domain-containing protein [Deltaproteobacteria bacterium]
GDLLGVKGSGKPGSEQRQVSPFSEVRISGGIDVKIHTAKETTCTVSGDDNIVPLVVTENVGSSLKIYTRENVRPKTPITIVLTTPALARLDLSGSCDADVHGVHGAGLGVEISGSGDVDLVGIDVDRLDVDVSGSGDVSASGSADRVEFEVSGSGDGRMGALCTKDTVFRVSGSGSVEVAVTHTLEARISGSGTFKYLGDPTVDKHVSGSAEIRRIGPLPAQCSPPPVRPAAPPAPAAPIEPDGSPDSPSK